MKLRVVQVGVGLNLSQNTLDTNKLKVVKQISLGTKPIFSDKSKHLYVAAGCDINVYNTQGGNLQTVLEKHRSKVIGICNHKADLEDQIVSCDEEINIFHWKIGSNNSEKLLQLEKPNFRAISKAVPVYFGIGIDSSFLILFEDPESCKTELFFYSTPFKGKAKFIVGDIIKGPNTIGTSRNGQFLAAIKDKQLYVTKHPYNTDRDYVRCHWSSKKLCCLAFHPKDDIVAVGDITGAVTLWHNIMIKNPVKINLHWHTLPVRDLSFSNNGTELYTGGEECVIVRWQLTQNNRKTFLPRLGMPIHYIATDRDNNFVAALHDDKAISIINAREMVLEGFTQSLSVHIPKHGDQPLPVGLLYHPKMKSLIKNGKMGHLQFFHPINSSVMFNLDITMSNFVSKDREGNLPNSDVTLARISDDGCWLVTVESCQLTKDVTEIYLKFWGFLSEDQRWELNTSIQMPHLNTITCISLASLIGSQNNPMCITGSEDGKFKLWKLIEYLDVQGKQRCHWNSRAVREFRSLPISSVLFSPDNTLLAVAFGSVITLWTPDSTVSLLGTLSQPFLSERIRDLSFSYGERAGSLIISRSDNWLCCWDLLSCSLKWRVNIHSSCFTIEKSTGIMLVFSKNKEIFFFDPHSNEPILKLNTLSSSEVLGATFVPSDEKFTVDVDVPWGSNSSLYFIDKEQILYTVQYVDDLESHVSKFVRNSLNQLTSDHHREVDRNLYSAIVARSRNITRSRLEIDVVSSPITSLSSSFMERLNQVDIHNMESLVNLMDFLYLLAPDLKKRDLEARTDQALKYQTIKDGVSDSNASTDIRCDPVEIGNMVENIKNINYKNIVSYLNS